MALDGIALISALATYRRQVLPQVREELGRLEGAARAGDDRAAGGHRLPRRAGGAAAGRSARKRPDYMTYYPSNAVAAKRLAFIAHRASAAVEKLRHHRRHAAILAGVADFYLSAPAARGEYAAPIHKRMLEALGAPAKLVMATRRSRRRG